ncbi:hypothetical protein GCM10029964_043650 [Kibdelosporangium lantanae]
MKTFVEANRGVLKSNVDKLTGITRILADQRSSLAEALDTAPNAVTNLTNAINPKTGALEARADLDYYATGSMVACNTKPNTTPVTKLDQNCDELKPGTDPDAPPLLLPPIGQQYTGGPK